jgi:hypothetical protein
MKKQKQLKIELLVYKLIKDSTSKPQKTVIDLICNIIKA